MPFDNPTQRVEVSPRDRHADLRFLATVLRTPKLWPPGFRYDWFEPSKCGLGLGEYFGINTWSAGALGITDEERDRIFINMAAGRPLKVAIRLFTHSKPTPKDIAYEIDKVLARYSSAVR